MNLCILNICALHGVYSSDSKPVDSNCPELSRFFAT